MRQWMTLLLSLFVAIMLFPSVAQAVDAGDTRQVVTEVDLTYEWVVPKCGEPVICRLADTPEGAVWHMDSFYWRWSTICSQQPAGKSE